MACQDKQVLHFLAYPMNFTGILNWFAIASTTPPWPSHSNLVMASGRHIGGSGKLPGLLKRILPVDPSNTSNTSCGASGMIFLITRLILLSSSMR